MFLVNLYALSFSLEFLWSHVSFFDHFFLLFENDFFTFFNSLFLLSYLLFNYADVSHLYRISLDVQWLDFFSHSWQTLLVRMPHFIFFALILNVHQVTVLYIVQFQIYFKYSVLRLYSAVECWGNSIGYVVIFQVEFS